MARKGSRAVEKSLPGEVRTDRFLSPDIDSSYQTVPSWKSEMNSVTECPKTK